MFQGASLTQHDTRKWRRCVSRGPEIEAPAVEAMRANLTANCRRCVKENNHGRRNRTRADCFLGRFNCVILNIIRLYRRGGTMNALITGCFIAAFGTLAFFIYNKAELSLRLSRQIKQTAERCRQLP